MRVFTFIWLPEQQFLQADAFLDSQNLVRYNIPLDMY